MVVKNYEKNLFLVILLSEKKKKKQDLTIPDGKCQTARFTHLSTRPSVRCVPQPHGWMTLVKRHPTIYLRAEQSNVAETELGKTMALRS